MEEIMDIYVTCHKCGSLLSSCKCGDYSGSNNLYDFDRIIEPPPPEPVIYQDRLIGWYDRMTPTQIRPYDYGKPTIDISGLHPSAPGMNMYIPNYFTGIG
jgi:hypothetical protein